MGVMMGLLFGALDQPLNAEELTLRQQLTHGARQMVSRSWHMAKAFAVMGAIFSAAECTVEKVNGRLQCAMHVVFQAVPRIHQGIAVLNNNFCGQDVV